MPDPPLYWCPAIVVDGGDPFWLPPWVSASEQRSQQVEVISVPATDAAVLGEVRPNQGARISLSATYAPGTTNARTVLDLFESIWNACKGQRFVFFLFSDRGWSECALASFNPAIPLGGPLNFLQATLDIVSASSEPSTDNQLDFEDYDSDYPHAAEVGRPAGGASSGGGSIVMVERPRQVFNGEFNGARPSASANGTEHRFVVGGSSGSLWRLKVAQITACEDVSDEDLTLRFSTTSKAAGGGSNVDVTLDAGDRFSAAASANILFAQGSTVYVWIQASGGVGPSNVAYQFQLEHSAT